MGGVCFGEIFSGDKDLEGAGGVLVAGAFASQGAVAEVDIAAGGAFDGAADIVGEHDAVPGGIIMRVLGFDDDGEAEGDVGFIDGEAAAGDELDAEGAGGFLGAFLEENEAGVGVEDFIVTGWVGFEPGFDFFGGDAAGEFAHVF